MSSRTAAPDCVRPRAMADRARVTSLASSGSRSPPAPGPSPVTGIRGLSIGSVGAVGVTAADVAFVVCRPMIGERRLVLDPADEQRADPVAPAPGALGGQLDALHPDLRARDRYPAELLGEQPADGVDVVVLQLDAQSLGELVDVQPGAHAQ